MKIVLRLMLVFGLLISCTEKKQKEQPIPVESDNGIGDGAQPLDSLLTESETFKDSIQ